MLFVSFLRHSPSLFPEGNLVLCIVRVRSILQTFRLPAHDRLTNTDRNHSSKSRGRPCQASSCRTETRMVAGKACLQQPYQHVAHHIMYWYPGSVKPHSAGTWYQIRCSFELNFRHGRKTRTQAHHCCVMRPYNSCFSSGNPAPMVSSAVFQKAL